MDNYDFYVYYILKPSLKNDTKTKFVQTVTQEF